MDTQQLTSRDTPLTNQKRVIHIPPHQLEE